MNAIVLKDLSDFPEPDVVRFCQIDSDGAIVTDTGLVHILQLNSVGEYFYNFRIASNVLLQNHYRTRPYFGQNDTSPMEVVTESSLYEIDSVLNYIDYISLCIDSPENILSQISDHPTPPHTFHQDVTALLGTHLDFLPDTPLLSASLYGSNIYIVIKFHQRPPTKYYIGFDVGFVADPEILYQMTSCPIRHRGRVHMNGQYQSYGFYYNNGKLSLNRMIY